MASCQAPDWLIRAVVDVCAVEECLTHVEPCGEGWSEIYIYRRPFMLEVIRAALEHDDTTPFGAWVWGALFGYSLEAIGEHVVRSGAS